MTTDVADTLVGALHTGLLGGGSMARVPSHAARANGADPTALATSRLESAEGAATSLGVSRADADAAALLSAGDSDVVHICTPNATHAPLAKAAIAAGTHVMCEKPLATSVDDARSLVAAAEAAHLVASRSLRLPLSPDGARGT